MLIKKENLYIIKNELQKPISDYINITEAGLPAINKTDLYSILINPIIDKLESIKKIVIVPDGQIGFVPFDILKKKNDDEFLCEKFEISLAPSISILYQIQKKSYPDDRVSFIGFGITNYQNIQIDEDVIDNEHRTFRKMCDAKLKNLKFPVSEVSDISKLFNETQVSLYKEEDAKEENIITLSNDGALSNYKFIHFACHGLYDYIRPFQSGLIMSEYQFFNNKSRKYNGLLSVKDIASLKMKADLVTLSACQTGLGQIGDGDSIIGLTRSFMIAGAKNVISSLTYVDDEYTKNFMVKMYNKIIHKNLSYCSALNETKRDMIKNNNDVNYRWAAYTFWGL
jgi:CHAT domain-containing protein